MTSLVLLALVVVAVAAGRVSYEGYQVWRIDVTSAHMSGLRHVVEEHNLDVWAEGKDWMDVMINPEQVHVIGEKLTSLGTNRKIKIPNVQPLVERNYRDQEKHSRAALDFETYNLFEDIEAYLADLPGTDDRTSLVSLGQTLEGRDMWQLKISVGDGKPAVWVDCGIHAREWITQATCLWGINYLLTSYGSDPAATDLLDAVDIYIMPVYNADGYVYTQTDRLWRKNRMHYSGDLCIGIDLNRNYDDHFGGLGTSTNSCSEIYTGPIPASELETQAVQDAIVALAPTAKALFTLHSYSQLWMYPYSWTYDLPPEADQMDAVSAIGVAALESVNGVSYTYGPVAETIYPAAGTTEDFAYAAGITYSFTLELRDTGEFGFLLPENQIKETAEETWAGLIAAILAIP